MKIRFVWDPAKNRENIRKHGVSFEEASSLFTNFPREIFYDPDHSLAEHRYIAAGFSDRGRALLVHCENRPGTVIRIISVRKATPRALRRNRQMRSEYDFAKLTRAEPTYQKHLKQSLTLRLDASVVRHFKRLATKKGIPYQTLINFVLREYANLGLEPTGNWPGQRRRAA